MSELKPIEAGCKAVIVKGHLTGKPVEVGEYYGEHPRIENKGLWNVDLVTAAVPDDNGCYIGVSLYPEDGMMRIDDPDLKKPKKNKIFVGKLESITIDGVELEGVNYE